MKKTYSIYKVEHKEYEVPDGYHTTTHTKYTLTQVGYPCEYHTLESVEDALAEILSREPDTYTILPIYRQQ
jgi:hypothetical protein